ncbi:ABC transporter permease [Paenibacillus baekrokdamisoli]|uniref:ABC transporter permease n=1 Tax=Paenibacillus baekrokdamisoli TaxID=1712516 RepID=A0A3G9J7S3_9BACL|nr:carbohydrate ABC transporter permease [Paenibacillus baekrokdamisoli]MBB3067779.1 raffinose/stachyose/melibiose transport system permease protein [Paenibacillus baekrokdamisoli]BBH19039.1 ABC transporter permease [Paenibacillus baekrokdamisoli]
MRSTASVKIPSYVFMLLLMILYLGPLLFVFNVSLKSYDDYLLNPLSFIHKLNWSNYKEAWQEGNFVNYIGNSLLYTVTSTVGTVLVSVFAAFPIARGYVKWGGFFYLFFLISQFLPNPIVAQYKLMLGLREIAPEIAYDTKWGFILLKTTGTGVIFMMFVGYIKSISRDLDEAASMDGIGYTRFIFRILLPLMKPILATGIILTAIAVWNDFIGPLQYLPSAENYPITAGLREFKGQYGNNWPLLACGVTIVAAPLIFLYTFIQKYIVDGALAGAVKS